MSEGDGEGGLIHTHLNSAAQAHTPRSLDFSLVLVEVKLRATQHAPALVAERGEESGAGLLEPAGMRHLRSPTARNRRRRSLASRLYSRARLLFHLSQRHGAGVADSVLLPLRRALRQNFPHLGTIVPRR